MNFIFGSFCIFLIPTLMSFTVQAARKPRAKKGCANELQSFDGLRGTGGPQDRVHTARISKDRKSLYINAGPNELSPLVARVRITPVVAKALREGTLEALDGVEVLDGETTLKFKIDGTDHLNKPRLRLTGEFRGIAFKVSGCSSYREGAATL